MSMVRGANHKERKRDRERKRTKEKTERDREKNKKNKKNKKKKEKFVSFWRPTVKSNQGNGLSKSSPKSKQKSKANLLRFFNSFLCYFC